MTQKLWELGEKKIVSRILHLLTPNELLIDGLGHDSAFINLEVGSEETLLVNTDRSGINVAYSLGVSDGKCVGDFAVSHAISDILASGGDPVAVSLAFLIPEDLTIDFLEEVVLGADEAARKYGAFIACGDTKENPKFAIVVTAIGKCKRDERLLRSGAKPGDYVVSSGSFGTMAAGLLVHKKHLSVSDREKAIFDQALIFQNPPYPLTREIAKRHFAGACMDNSDGLAGTIHTICASSGVGAVIYKDCVPIIPEVKAVAGKLGIEPFQLALGSGDWQHIYAVPKDKLQDFMSLAETLEFHPAVIGKFTETPEVLIDTPEGTYKFRRVENDRFGSSGISFFSELFNGIKYLEERDA